MRLFAFLLLLNGIFSSHVIKAEEKRSAVIISKQLIIEETSPPSEVNGKQIYIAIEYAALDVVSHSVVKDSLVVKRKIVAIGLAVTLGVFGVHRLYLGTAPKVPLIYTLTLGGGFGVLVVSDIIAILSSKKLDAFSPNENVFMWAK